MIDPPGRVIAESSYYNRIARAIINLDRFIMHQDQNLEKIPLIQGKYGKAVLIDTNARLGVSLLYSCTPERTAGEIAAEFELVELDSLMNSSAAAAKQKRGSAA